MILEGFDYVSDVYNTCKELNKPVINLSGYDISTNNKRSFTAANPIIIEEDNVGVFNGAIIWESMNLNKIFDEMIIPKSFKNGKYPFIQIRMPEYPEEDDPVSESGNILYKSINQKFYDEVPYKEYLEVTE